MSICEKHIRSKKKHIPRRATQEELRVKYERATRQIDDVYWPKVSSALFYRRFLRPLLPDDFICHWPKVSSSLVEGFFGHLPKVSSVTDRRFLLSLAGSFYGHWPEVSSVTGGRFLQSLAEGFFGHWSKVSSVTGGRFLRPYINITYANPYTTCCLTVHGHGCHDPCRCRLLKLLHQTD